MTRRAWFQTAVLAALYADEKDPLILLTPADAGRIKDMLARSEPAVAGRREIVRAGAGRALKEGPWSVTYSRPARIQLPPNDYYSEGPYFWPDPKNPGGPYLRKDGERNPERFMGNRKALGDLSAAALALGMGAYFLGDDRYGEHGSRVLRVWFVDPQTRMNPNLEHGQAVIGRNEGRGTGMIDTVSLIHAAIGAELLKAAGKLDESTVDGVRRWYAEYLEWMTTSKKGLDEKSSGNNHATWWTAQVSAYATFTRNQAALEMAWEHYRTYLVPREIQPDGSCPKEEARTNSLSYSTMNLDAFSVICRIAEMHGVDLWRFHAPNGTGVDKCFRYLMPYVLERKTWRKQQISRYSNDGTVFAGLAGLGLKDAELSRAYLMLPRAQSPWVTLIDTIVRSATRV